MPVTVILPRSLVSLIPGTRHATEVDAATVREAIDRLDELTPGLRNRLVDAGPVLRRHINVYVDREPATLDTPLRPGATVHVIPAVSGG
ncbi:MAG TPA: MoaD/ThiS family protein [Candidatus Limnocylindrales bacterium]|nr:MoaD/ThiS family protein [Candidatus Limnocylindrales bacterium]